MCTFVHVCLHTCVPSYMCTYIHVYLRTCVPTCVHVYLCTCVPTCVHVYLHTCVPPYMCTSIHVYLRTCVPTYIHVYLRTCVPTYMCTYVHVHLHTCVPLYILTCEHLSMSVYIEYKQLARIISWTSVPCTDYVWWPLSIGFVVKLQSNLVSEYTWGPSKLLLTISSTC